MPRTFEERITATINLPILEHDSVGMAIPLKSILLESEKQTAISSSDVEVKMESPFSKKISGSYLIGAPQLEGSIKQTWTSLPSFLPSYQTKEPYRDPYVLDDTGEIYYGQWGCDVPEGRGFLYMPHSHLYESSWK